MRSSLVLATPLAALALAAAARPATAQRAVAEDARPVVLAADPVVAARPVAAYRFAVSPRTAGIPDLVTVGDSAGVLVATFRLPGAAAERPMVVEVLDTDLVLQGETPAGVLTLRLGGQSAPSATAQGFGGRWALGERSGQLRGRLAR